MLLERQVSGMIFAGGQYAEADAPHEHYVRLLRLRLPVVLVNAAAEHLDFPRVSTDDAVAMEQAHAHLAYLGHERIGLILGEVVMLRLQARRMLLWARLGIFLMPLFPLALAFPLALPIVAGSAFLAGFGAEVFGVLWDTTVQQEIPGESLSRSGAARPSRRPRVPAPAPVRRRRSRRPRRRCRST